MERPVLRIDSHYRNTNNWNDPKDVFNRMFKQFPDRKGIPNVQGIRTKSKITKKRGPADVAFVILITNLTEVAWPDSLDPETGIFIYFGDNRNPGSDLHEKHGNQLLSDVFALLHNGHRDKIPPFLCFQSIKTNRISEMKFLGLAVPGAFGMTSDEDIVAVWRMEKEKRFQNYKCHFTILNENNISWNWLDELVSGKNPASAAECPPFWRKWTESGIINALECTRKKEPRNMKDQAPKGKQEQIVLAEILKLSSREFEFAAKDILTLFDHKFINLEVTPPTKDGGRDIIGNYIIGETPNELTLDIYAEAKHWTGGVGVKPMSRLISRLKHRDIGVFITTSYFNKQVQEELIEDNHPVILISGGDIARLLIRKDIAGTGHEESFNKWILAIKNSSSLS